MIRLQRGIVASIDTPEGLRGALQQAVMLEHSTIPPYLYALFSIKPGHNVEIAKLLKSVVFEEMNHMAMAANILNALGGVPGIDRPEFIPRYPGPLPGSVDTSLTVRLQRLSLDAVESVFMSIEEPEDPLEFPRGIADAGHLTIGQFYDAIRKQIEAAGDGAFVGDKARQMTTGVGGVELVPITDVATAVAAIEEIVEQGEGTSTSPLDFEGDIAHYYRFAEIRHGRKLVPNPDAPPDPGPDEKYAYTGDPIPFEPEGVNPVVADPSAAGYRAGTKARRLNDTFNYTYTAVLRSLHETFDGRPEKIRTAIGAMEACRGQAHEMMSHDLGDGTTAGPSFEYLPVNP